MAVDGNININPAPRISLTPRNLACNRIVTGEPTGAELTFHYRDENLFWQCKAIAFTVTVPLLQQPSV